jgi:putative hemin transport protein
MNNIDTELPTSLKERWASLKEQTPGLRIRDAAERLGVGEAELLVTGMGDTVTRLRGDWGELVGSLEALGPVMALTRNAHAVHERKGVYRNISIKGMMGLVLDEEIDLRVFLSRWHLGFAVVEPTKDGIRRSLQFFDRDGTAVHKIYLQPGADVEAFEELVRKFRDDDQSDSIETEAVETRIDRPDEQIDFEGLFGEWREMKDTHEFFGLLRRYDAGRLQALRNAPPDLVTPLPSSSLRELLTTASAERIPIMVFVASPGVIQIHSGPVDRVVVMGPWLNVLDPRFNLHVREDAIATTWIVRKPTADGTVTSVEVFDVDGGLIALLFGKRKPGMAESEAWRAMVEGLGVDTPQQQADGKLAERQV